ncbi:MAG: site-2 protease family protein [Phycisphaera sp.]|nr:site-2 protease family protein [Phycisphaera sp.]
MLTAPLQLAAFLELLNDKPGIWLGVVVGVTFSIVLHELAHGWAAIWQGDRTPILTGHMTANPIVHMGPVSIILLLTCGIAWGAMPVDPTRFRSKYGDALVAAAGPAMTFLIALVALTGYGLWVRFAGLPDTELMTPLAANSQLLLWHLGRLNCVLVVLNLLPIPPLDGSRILANFSPAYAHKIRAVHDPQIFMFALIAIIAVFSYTSFGLFDIADHVGLWWVQIVSGHDLMLTDG